MPSGYGMIQTAVMRLDDLSIQAKAVFSLLASYTGSKDYCFPSIQTICKDLNYSIKSKGKIIKYLKELEKVGLLQTTKLYPGDKFRTHNKYEIMAIYENTEKPRGSQTATCQVPV